MVATAADNFSSLLVIDNLDLSSYSTKSVLSIIKSLGAAGKKLLFIVDSASDCLQKSLKNLRNVNIIDPNVVNSENVLGSEVVVLSEGSLDFLNKRLGLEKVGS